MRTLVGTVWAICLSVLMTAAQPARADAGRVAFSGAIVATTCGVAAESVARFTHTHTPAPDRSRVACAGAGGGTTSVPQAYALSFTRFSANVSDRLLRYFHAYAATQNMTAGSLLATQTFE